MARGALLVVDDVDAASLSRRQWWISAPPPVVPAALPDHLQGSRDNTRRKLRRPGDRVVQPGIIAGDWPPVIPVYAVCASRPLRAPRACRRPPRVGRASTSAR